MNVERFAIVQFCDDIRREVGNKVSLMGCYTGELLVEQLPAVLPNLCAQVKVATPRSKPFERLTLRAYLNDDLIAELELPAEQANNALRLIDPEATRIFLGAVMTFTPFIIEREGMVRIEAETEEGTLKVGRLRLLLAENYRRAQEDAKRCAEIPSGAPVASP